MKPACILTGLLLLCSSAQAATENEHGQLTGPFTTVREVTVKCLECHQSQGVDILRSNHWTWQRTRTVNNSEQPYKKTEGLTTFGLSAKNNPNRCMGCHISTHPPGEQFNAAEAENIDCLICHDTTGKYSRKLNADGMQPGLVYIARNVGRPAPKDCLTCHGAGCGLPGVQHNGVFTGDIHLKQGGAGLNCQSCHPAGGRHLMPRQMIQDRGADRTATCSSCHTSSPHSRQLINDHTEVIACQSCHIPRLPGNDPVIISWNWLAGGAALPLYQQTETGRTLLLDGNGFTYAMGVEPLYLWDNGEDLIYQRGTKITPEKATLLQYPTPRSPNSKIGPFSAQQATQLYDAKYRYLISPKLTDKTGPLFTGADWNIIAREGMHSVRLPYSGQYGFTTTLTHRRMNHGVAPADQALDCMDCHGKTGRINWQLLGYDQDPWGDGDLEKRPVTIAPDREREITGTDLPPVREMILPVDPGM